MRRILAGAGGLLVAGFLLVQLVPYGRDHTNPAVTGEPAWNAAVTRELAVAACFDCHSNETSWPWYASVAPASWMMQRHVDEGRAALNFSEWGTGEQEGDEVAETVRDGAMPPWDYALIHPDARLSDAERATLIDGLAATFGEGESDGEEDEGGDEGGDD